MYDLTKLLKNFLFLNKYVSQKHFNKILSNLLSDNFK